MFNWPYLFKTISSMCAPCCGHNSRGSVGAYINVLASTQQPYMTRVTKETRHAWNMCACVKIRKEGILNEMTMYGDLSTMNNFIMSVWKALKQVIRKKKLGILLCNNRTIGD